MLGKMKKVLAMLLAVVLAVPVVSQVSLSEVQAATAVYEGRNITISSAADVVNLTEEYLPQLGTLEKGTITVRYRSNGSQGLGALFSLSSTAAGEKDTYAVAYVNPAQGKVGVEVRSTNPATNYNQVNVIADIQDDAWHTVTYVFGASKFQIYVDGKLMKEEAKSGFFSKISKASSVKVGALDRTTGLNNWLFKGDIDLINVSGEVMSEAEILKLQEATTYEKQLPPEPEDSKRTDYRLFYNGYANSAAYRIPSMITTESGVLIAAIDKRQSGAGDAGNIDTMIRRSLDGGATWLEPQILINLPSGSARHALTIDANMVQDVQTGRIFLMADMFPESNALMDAATLVTGSGYKTVGDNRYFILRDYVNSVTENTYSKEYTIREHGVVWDEETQQPTDYVVPNLTNGTLYQKAGGKALTAADAYSNMVSGGDVSGNAADTVTVRTDGTDGTDESEETVSGNAGELDGIALLTEGLEPVGNIYLYTGSGAAPLKAMRTSYLWMVYSDDDGATWSEPRNITGMVKKEWMKFSGTGPGRGIQMSTGRLILPVYVTNKNVGASQSAAVIYSDDHGETWAMGETVNDGIIPGGAENMTSGAMMTESQVVEVECKDGTRALKLFCRNTSGKVAIATSYDDGVTWEDSLAKDNELQDAYCQLTVVPYPYVVKGYEGRQMFLFANPNNTYGGGRNHGTLRLGYYDQDKDGFVWIASRLVESSNYAYSCLSVIEDNKIGLLWEGKNLDINFSTFNLQWLMADQTPAERPQPKVLSVNWEDGNIAVTFDQPIMAMGQPVLNAVVDGNNPAALAYVSGSGTNVLLFQTDLDTSHRFTFTGIEAKGKNSYGNNVNGVVAEGGFDGFELEAAVAPSIADTVAAAGYESIRITFTPPAGAAVYDIYRSESKSGAYEKIGTAQDNSYVDGVGTGRTYWYKVKSVDGKAVSAVFTNALPTGMQALRENALVFEDLSQTKFDGSSLVDISGKVEDVKDVENGSVIIKFKTESKKDNAVLLMGKKAGETIDKPYGGNRKTAFTLVKSKDNMFFRADLSHTRAFASGNGAADLSDGQWHIAVYSSEKGGKTMRATVDGKELFSFDKEAFAGIFSKFTNWDQLTIGGYYNGQSKDVMYGFQGSIAYVGITDEVLSDESAVAISSMEDPVITSVKPGYSSITLTFDLPDGGTYEIYRAAEADGTYEKIGTTSSNTYVDKTGSGASWYYQVRSQDGLKISASVASKVPTGLEAMKANAIIYEDLKDTVFDGNTVKDVSNKAAAVNGLDKGSVIVRFRTQDHSASGAFLVGKTEGETVAISGAVNKAAILLEKRSEVMCLRADLKHTRASILNTDCADGEWHTAAIINDTTAENAFRFTLDGKEVANFAAGSNNANVGFFSTVKDLNQLTIGGYYNGTSKDVNAGFKGEIAYVLVTDEVLDTEEANEITRTENGVVCDIASVMFDQAKDNTWVFTGGTDTAGGFDQTQGVRNYVGQFEEYIRWTKNGGIMGRQRYMINTGKSGRTVSDVAADFETLVKKYDPKAVSVLIGQEDWAEGTGNLEAFAQSLKTLTDKALALRENTGYLVIQTPFAQADSADNSLAKAYADAAKEYYENLSIAQKTRVLLVNQYKVTDNDKFKADCLDEQGHLNAYGHLAIAKNLAKAAYGSADNFPVSESSLKLVPVKCPSVYSREAAAVTAKDNSLTAVIPQSVLEMSSGWNYELQLGSQTIKGSFNGNTALISGLSKDAQYLLRVTSQDGSIRLARVMGIVRDGSQSQLVSDKQEDLTQLQQSIKTIADSKEAKTWLFVGDSITHGALHTYGYDSIHQTFEKFLHDELGRTDDVVINTAVSGATTKEQEDNSNERLDKYDADVVIVMLGTNDAANSLVSLENYRKNLTSIVTKIHEMGAVAVLRTPNPLRSGDNRALNLPKYAEVIRETAAAGNAILVDHYAEWSQELETRSYLWNNGWWNNDAIHPNPNGQLNMAQSLIHALGLYDASSAICNLSYEMPGSEKASTIAPQAQGGDNVVSVDIGKLETSYGSAFGKVTLKAQKDGVSYETQALDGEQMTLTGLKGDTEYQVSVVAQLKDSAVTVTFPAENVNVTEPVIAYNVTFLDKDGNVLKTQEVRKGSAAEAPAAPDVEGYTFKQWDKSFTNVQGDLTVQAVYEKIAVYKVTFLDKDGRVIKSQEVRKGSDAEAPAAPDVEGYTFKQWDKSFTNVQGDLTVQAVYEENVKMPDEADKKAMEQLLTQAGQKVSGEYTQESWQAFLTARTEAEKAVAKTDITKAQFNQAADGLRQAMDALVKADKGGDNQDDGKDSGSSDDNGSNDNSSDKGSSDSSEGNAQVNSPKTGDNGFEQLPVLLFVGLLGGVLVVIGKRKQNNK